MDYDKFKHIAAGTERAVLLLEGTRTLPTDDRGKLVQFGKILAEHYPHAQFRTGNAPGSDEAFAEGVAAVDPSRLEVILPHVKHRKTNVASQAFQIPFTAISQAAEQLAIYHTTQSSPQYASLIEKRNSIPKLRAKSNYLLRDTLKVIGDPESGLSPATLGLFYVNPKDPMKGGTGHTIRVCQTHRVPIVFQEEWMQWFTEKGC